MSQQKYPQFFADRIFSNDEALQMTVKSDSTIASGFATSEPHTFYDGLWDYIREQDIRNLNIRQALFMAPHRICVGDALSSKGLLGDLAEKTSISLIARVARKANTITKKVEGLKKLIEHYDEMKERKINFTSPFIGAATNMIIPSNPVTNLFAGDYVDRNTTRTGITDMQSIHFPDAVDSMGYDPDGKALIDTFVLVMTPPNAKGEMSHAVANGANGEITDKILASGDVNLLLYVNKSYPFTIGHGDAGNTIHVDAFKKLAAAGKLFVVEDDGQIPALPAGAFDDPSEVELRIAEHVVNHIELNRHYTFGRAIQVGFGGTGVLAIRALKNSSWSGRSYTEMLEPFTLDLYEAGKIAGSHFVESDGRRTQLDGKMVCTFTIAEKGSDFYEKLNNHPAVIVAPASRVVIPEAFHFGLGINNCLAVDFHGHVNSAGRYKNHHSGIGGGAQIFRGLSKGGVGYLCMKSTHTTIDGERKSSILPFMPQGTPISHVGPDLMGGRSGARFFLVTEHGVALLSGQSQANFIKNIIGVAHPDHRDELKAAAWEEFRVSV